MTLQNGTVRWVVLGCGQIAVDKSLPGLLAAGGARLTAIADPLEARRALALDLARQQGGEPRVHPDMHRQLQDASVDAVYIRKSASGNCPEEFE